MGVIHHARNGRGVKYLAEQRTPTTQQKVPSMDVPPHTGVASLLATT